MIESVNNLYKNAAGLQESQVRDTQGALPSSPPQLL